MGFLVVAIGGGYCEWAAFLYDIDPVSDPRHAGYARLPSSALEPLLWEV